MLSFTFYKNYVLSINTVINFTKFLYSLRISRLTDEMRETEFGETSDDTFQEMVKDFLR